MRRLVQLGRMHPECVMPAPFVESASNDRTLCMHRDERGVMPHRQGTFDCGCGWQLLARKAFQAHAPVPSTLQKFEPPEISHQREREQCEPSEQRRNKQ